MKNYVYKDETVNLHISRYIDNNNTAVCLSTKEGEPFATLSVNIEKLRFGTFCVDTNNCPGAEKFLTENNIATPTGDKFRSGFCEYPVYKLTDEVISTLCSDED